MRNREQGESAQRGGQRVLAPLLIAALAALAAPAALAQDESPVGFPESPAVMRAQAPAAASGELPFSKLPYAEARAAAETAGKLFVVDATATWCGPCKQMEREAWPAAEVGAWLAEHAIAVQLDVDAHREIAQSLGIEAMPTIIVFRNEIELARHVGKLGAADLVGWLDDVAEGRAGAGPLQARGRELLQSGDYKARYDIAKQLQQQREDDLALQHYLWLWPNTRDTSFSGVRVSFMLTDMKRLADRSEAARAAFDEVFEQLRQGVAGTAEPEPRAWREFASWCRYFERQEELRAWYQEHRGADGSVASPVAAEALSELFVSEGDWITAGRIGYLEQRAAQEISLWTAMRGVMGERLEADMQAQMKAIQDRQLRTDLSRLCAAAWAVGQDDVGRAIAADLLAELDDAPTRVELATVTFGAVGARPEQLAWLDEAAALGGEAEALAKLRAAITAAQPGGAAPPAPVLPASAPEPLR